MQVFRKDVIRVTDGSEVQSNMESSDRNALAKAALAKENLQLRGRIKDLEEQLAKLRNEMIAQGVKDGLEKHNATSLDTASAIAKQRQRYLPR